MAAGLDRAARLRREAPQRLAPGSRRGGARDRRRVARVEHLQVDAVSGGTERLAQHQREQRRAAHPAPDGASCTLVAYGAGERPQVGDAVAHPAGLV
ncbi:MAG: hypothetical protein M5T61_06735 [Acidimicrobiia bacterium]|nr:hypothetical protein [Acidimicrobiia bacterium]